MGISTGGISRHKTTLLLGLILMGALLPIASQPAAAVDNSTAKWTSTNTVVGWTTADAIIQTVDGGYIIAGTNYTTSYENPAANPEGAVWVFKLDSSGNRQWVKIFSGAQKDIPVSIINTSDGGFALAASTWANRTDTAGDEDFWLIKFDSSGNVQFSQTYGTSKADTIYSFVQASDGGYTLAGQTLSDNGKAWVVKVDSAGNTLWDVTCGTATTQAYAIVQASDGGYVLAGTNYGFPGTGKGWLFKVDASGAQQWEKTYLGNVATFNSIVLSDDGGYAIAGYLEGALKNNVTLPENPSSFALLAKTDSTGAMQWTQAYVGSYTYAVTENNGECILNPATNSVMWNQTYAEGGTNSYPGQMKAYSLVKTNDGGYALIGGLTTYRSDPNWGLGDPYAGTDFWLIKTDSFGNMQWNHAYGAVQFEEAKAGIQTTDGGYALVGTVDYYNYIWVVKTDGLGQSAESADPAATPTNTLTSPITTTSSPAVPEIPVNVLCISLIALAAAIATVIYKVRLGPRKEKP
jgi:hypothetical protein